MLGHVACLRIWGWGCSNGYIDTNLIAQNDSIINAVITSPRRNLADYYNRFNEPAINQSQVESYRFSITVLLYDYFKVYRVEKNGNDYKLHIKEYAVSTTSQQREDSLVSYISKKITNSVFAYLNLMDSEIQSNLGTKYILLFEHNFECESLCLLQLFYVIYVEDIFDVFFISDTIPPLQSNGVTITENVSQQKHHVLYNICRPHQCHNTRNITTTPSELLLQQYQQQSTQTITSATTITTLLLSQYQHPYF